MPGALQSGTVPTVSGRTTAAPRLRMLEADSSAGHLEVIGQVRRALLLLRESASTQQLEGRIARATLLLGFDRAVYARVRGAEWQPVQSPDDVISTPVLLDPSFEEHRVIAEQTPRVVGAACVSRVLPVAWCATYLAVPVAERGTVVGLIHAGHRDPKQRPSPLDCEMLCTVAEALAPSFASARAGGVFRELMARMSQMAEEFGQGGSDSGPSFGLDPPVLTSREREVLALMAAGQTNGQIARKLVIAEGTAKSHVKRIMRKLHAANRAEAVAAWMRNRERHANERI